MGEMLDSIHSWTSMAGSPDAKMLFTKRDGMTLKGLAGGDAYWKKKSW